MILDYLNKTKENMDYALNNLSKLKIENIPENVQFSYSAYAYLQESMNALQKAISDLKKIEDTKEDG